MKCKPRLAALLLLVVFMPVAVAQVLQNPKTMHFHGFRVVLEADLKRFCIPEGDKCFERGVVCARTENIVVCRRYQKT